MMQQSVVVMLFSMAFAGGVLVLGAPTETPTTESSVNVTGITVSTTDNSTFLSNTTLTNGTDIDIAAQCGGGGGAKLEGTPDKAKFADVAAWFKDIDDRAKKLDELTKSDPKDDATTARTKEQAIKDLSAAKQKVVKYQPPLTKQFKTSDAPKMRAIENDLSVAGKKLQGVAYKSVICGLGGVAMAWCGEMK